MIKLRLKIKLTISGPLITQSTVAGNHGLDAVMAINLAGEHYIPGTHVIGKLRQSWEELRDLLDKNDQESDAVPVAAEINRLLGKQLANGEVIPQTKTLYLGDFIETQVHESHKIRYRIQLDTDTGAVKKHQQQMIESLYASGEPVAFKGELIALCSTQADANKLTEQIKCGLQWISQLGAERTTGFGRLNQIEIIDQKIQTLNFSKNHLNNESRFAIAINPLAPFCIAQKPLDGNLFEGQEVIPGNVIRGALASMLQQLDNDDAFKALRKEFHHIQIQHAFPSSGKNHRPVKAPLSLVQSEGLYDVALLERACLINNESPRFCVDWKDKDYVDLEEFGWPNLKRELRVRTAIDSESLRAAQSQLFAYETIVPDNHHWLSIVDISRVSEANRREVKKQLSALFDLGLTGIGKTKVPADVSVCKQQDIKPTIMEKDFPAENDKAGILILTLQTPALLFSCSQMEQNTNLKTVYQNNWGNLCDSLELQRFFARQRLAGGEYQHRRFRAEKIYQPWVLTEAGSVFVFTITDWAKAKSAVEGWQRTGLPLPEQVLCDYDLTTHDEDQHWQYCPYIPQNGFGEIALNLQTHWDKKPDNDICTPIEDLEEVK